MTALNASMVRYKKERDDLRGERETMVRQLNDVKQSAAAMKAVVSIGLVVCAHTTTWARELSLRTCA